MSDSYYDDFERDIEHIKHTLLCITIGCYTNLAISFCLLL